MDFGSFMNSAGGAAAASGGGNFLSQYYQNQWSARQAEISRGFMQDMSNTAHQREVDDLRAAGLNPILSAAGGGASTPSAPMASMSMEDIGSSAVSSAQAAMRLKKDMEIADQQIDNMKEQNKKTEKETENISSQTILNKALETKAREDAKVSTNSAKVMALQMPKLQNKANVENTGALGKFFSFIERAREAIFGGSPMVQPPGTR